MLAWVGVQPKLKKKNPGRFYQWLRLLFHVSLCFQSSGETAFMDTAIYKKKLQETWRIQGNLVISQP